MKHSLFRLTERHLLRSMRVLMVGLSLGASHSAFSATGALVHVNSEKCITTGGPLESCVRGAANQQFEKVKLAGGAHLYKTGANKCLAVKAGDSVVYSSEVCNSNEPRHQWRLDDGMIRNVGANACIASGGTWPAVASCNPQDGNLLFADGSAGLGIFNPFAAQCVVVNAHGLMESGSCSYHSGALFDYRGDRRLESMARPGQCIGGTTNLALISCLSAPTWTFSENRWRQDGTNTCVEIMDPHEAPSIKACGDWQSLKQDWTIGETVKYYRAQPLDVWGRNADGSAFRNGLESEGNGYAPPGSWQWVSGAGQGTINKVSAGHKFAWVLTTSGGLRKCLQPCYVLNQWSGVSAPTGITHIDVDPAGERIYAVSGGKIIWNRESGIGPWMALPPPSVSMKWVSAGPHWIWAVQTNDELWHCAQPCSSYTSWKKAPGLLRNLDMRHGWVYGTNSNGTVFRIRADLSSEWESFPEAGTMDQVSIGQRDVWGVRGGNIYQCQRPCNTSSAWTQVPGQLTYIDAE